MHVIQYFSSCDYFLNQFMQLIYCVYPSNLKNQFMQLLLEVSDKSWKQDLCFCVKWSFKLFDLDVNGLTVFRKNLECVI